VHIALADTVVAGNLMVVGDCETVSDFVETIVTVTVEGRFAEFDEVVDRTLVEDVAGDVRKLVVWLDEEVFTLVELVEEDFAVVVAVLMHKQALRILDEDALQPELIAEGVEIAMLVVYVPQKEDATTRSEFNALRHLSLLQLPETPRARNERKLKIMMCIVEPRAAEMKSMMRRLDKRNRNRNETTKGRTMKI
jgi:hypothetical protein